MGTNWSSVDEHLISRQAILDQLLMQVQAVDGELVDEDRKYSTNDNPLHIFTMQTEDLTTVQYYVVGEKKHILVHLTVFDEEETEIAMAAALHIANTFVWSE
jgi:hypothetical protein